MDPSYYLCLMYVMFLVLLCVMFFCVFVTFPYGVLGLVCYLILSALIFATFLTLARICEKDIYLEFVKNRRHHDLVCQNRHLPGLSKMPQYLHCVVIYSLQE